MSTARRALRHLDRHAVDDGDLVLDRGVVDHELEQEAVDLRLGQGVGALGLDRVLRGEHEERLGHAVRLAADRDLVLLHRLEQRGLHLGGRAVDLVGEQQVGEDRAVLGPERAVAGLPDARADEVGGQQVGRELDAAERAAQHGGERAHGQRLGQARHALEQHVAAGQQRDEQALEHRVLADDDALALVQRRLERAARLGGGIDLGMVHGFLGVGGWGHKTRPTSRSTTARTAPSAPARRPRTGS